MEGALLRAAPDHDAAAHGGAEFGEVAGVGEGAVLDGGVGNGEVVAFGFSEQPVEAYHFEAVVADDGAEFFRVGCGERLRPSEGEGRDLKAGVAVAGGLGAGAGEVVVAEGFVADGEFHGRWNFSTQSRRGRGGDAKLGL